jgi:hypothetical protein
MATTVTERRVAGELGRVLELILGEIDAITTELCLNGLGLEQSC